MYEVKNLKTAPRALPIPGRSVILQRQGSTCEIRDREYTELLKSQKTEGYIRVTKLEKEDPPEDVNCPGYKQYLRINAVKAAKERAERRARGDLS